MTRNNINNTENSSIQTNITNNPNNIQPKKRRDAGVEILRFLLIMSIIFLHMQQFMAANFNLPTQGWVLN